MTQKRKLYVHALVPKNLEKALSDTFKEMTVPVDSEFIRYLRTLDNPRIEVINNASKSTTYRVISGPIDPFKQKVEYWLFHLNELKIPQQKASTLTQLAKYPKIDELIETFDYERIIYGYKDENGNSIPIE
jgi:hypothetical protein